MIKIILCYLSQYVLKTIGQIRPLDIVIDGKINTFISLPHKFSIYKGLLILIQYFHKYFPLTCHYYIHELVL
jgi:hypothetical protein